MQSLSQTPDLLCRAVLCFVTRAHVFNIPPASHAPFLVPCAAPSCSPDYIASCCNEAGMRREALSGKTPRNWMVRPLDSLSQMPCLV